MHESAKQCIEMVSSAFKPKEIINTFDNPVFIISTPRSGSTLLFELLSQAKNIWTIGDESHPVYAQFPHLKAENENYDSGCLSEKHADLQTNKFLRALYVSLLRDANGARFVDVYKSIKRKPFCFLEKTPRNILNIDFILKVFPKARFIFLHRDPKQNISSIIEAWGVGKQTGQFVTYRDLPDWSLGYWCLLLPPEWRKLRGKGIAEIAAFQWQASNEFAISKLQEMSADRFINLSYDDLVNNTSDQLKRLYRFCKVGSDDCLDELGSSNLPLSKTTITKPDPDKWKRHEVDIMKLMPSLKSTVDKLEHLKS